MSRKHVFLLQNMRLPQRAVVRASCNIGSQKQFGDAVETKKSTSLSSFFEMKNLKEDCQSTAARAQWSQCCLVDEDEQSETCYGVANFGSHELESSVRTSRCYVSGLGRL